jgi:CheY-like chemotaxis protein
MKKRILIVEDEDVVSEMISFALEHEGYDVTIAENGRKGLDVLSQKKIDLIVCDIMMPIMDGYEFADTIKADPKFMSIPIIFLTAKTTEEDQIIGRLKGADDYITKPFETNLLLGAIAARLKWVDKYHTLGIEATDETRSRILSSLSEAFRNPLMSISGAAESIKEHLHGFDNEAVKKFLDIITEQTYRLGPLVEDLLSFAEFELLYANRKHSCPLLETLDQCVLVNSGEISQRMLTLHKQFPSQETDVAVPQRSLLRIFDRVLNRMVRSAFSNDELILKVNPTIDNKDKVEISFLLSHDDGRKKGTQAKSVDYSNKTELLNQPKAMIDLFIAEQILKKCEGRIFTQEKQQRLTSVGIIIPVER